MNRARWTAAIVAAALVVAFGGGLYIGISQRLQTAAAADASVAPNAVSVTAFGTAGAPQGVDFAKFWQAWSLLNDNFVQTHASNTIPTDQQKVYGAIAGLTESYGDPYTVFFPPKQASAFNDQIRGSFGGVGMELGEKNGAITVVAPLKDSPAEKAGIRSGDIVIAVDGTSTQSMSVDDAVGYIRGLIGTPVTLSIKRAGEAQPLTIKIVRDTIKVPVIKNYDTNGIYTIELYSFSENSADLFRQALRAFFQSGDTKLILDMRGNPGGYLDAAVEMASYFLPVGDTIVTEDFKGKQTNIVHRSLGYNVFANKKLSMAILVDQGSASASEILAGALSQQGVAKLIGTRTFGKGSVQQLIDLGGGAEIKITVARWLTPNGTNISDGGLQPDIKADRTQDDVTAGKDPQRDAAISWFATQ